MKMCAKCRAEYSGGEAFCPLDGARLVTASQLAAQAHLEDPLIGAVLSGRYVLSRRIGTGGMGVVYEARHTTLGKRFAVKILREQATASDDAVARFRQEAKSATRIGHDNIVQITDFGETDGGASYLVMELLDGEDLARVLASEHTLPLERAIPILLQVCRALGAAHDKGIVHRDLKPENIFLVSRGGEPDFVKIVDFGMAKMNDQETPGVPGRKLTKTGMIFGTPEYMSTEQAYGRPTDHRSDIYAVGIIAYEMLTGRVPFSGESFMAILSQHMLDAPPRMSEANPHVRVPEALERVIVACLAKSPDERPQSMQELSRALTRAVESIGMGHVAHAHPSEGSWAPPVSAEHPFELTERARIVHEGGERRKTPTPLVIDEEDSLPLVRVRRRGGGVKVLLLLGAAVGALIFAAGALALMRPQLFGLEPEPVVTGTAPVPVPVFDAGARSTDASIDAARDAGRAPEPVEPERVRRREGPSMRPRRRQSDDTEPDWAAPDTDDVLDPYMMPAPMG